MEISSYNYPSRRSNVLALNGMAATSQPLAAQAGIEILQTGGNAVDAAVAMAAVLCVTEPGSTGLGGDAFALIWSAEQNKLFGLNASGPAPARLTLERIRQSGWNQMPQRGPLTITVPGSVKGWESAVERFGSLPLNKILARAVEYARMGFPVSQKIAAAWRDSEELLASHSGSALIWLRNGRAPRAGEVFVNPPLANTLEVIGRDGSAAFYDGSVAGSLVETVEEVGGILTRQDLAEYDVEWVDPISTSYRELFSFYEMPPNPQGIVALMALNIARGFDLKSVGYGTADYWHLLIEAIKLAFADGRAYVGDPRTSPAPLAEMLSEDYAAERRAHISTTKAQIFGPGEPCSSGDTVYLTVADRFGNMVSWIQSLYEDFGSGITDPQAGVQLQNRAANFTLESGHPNQVAPGKRPYHTIIPGFITRNNQPWCSFGVMGGFMQPQGHLQVGLNLTEFGMDPQSALDAPRFRWIKDNIVAFEDGVPESVLGELKQRGHEVITPEPGETFSFGGGQVILRDADSGVLIGGSEPRKDGAAIGW